MERRAARNRNPDQPQQLPIYIVRVNMFIGRLPDETKIINLNDPPFLPKAPPSGWIELQSSLGPLDKVQLNSLLGTARVNGLETVGEIRTLTIEQIIAKSQTIPREANRNRTISLNRALQLKGLCRKIEPEANAEI